MVNPLLATTPSMPGVALPGDFHPAQLLGGLTVIDGIRVQLATRTTLSPVPSHK
jgi:hypothetical protein